MSAELVRKTTAEDTLSRKTTDPNVVSGGRLVAEALKDEGVDTIFSICGGHIIWGGCVAEVSVTSMCAMSSAQLMPPTVMCARPAMSTVLP
jgi:hypothetical protein